MRETLIKHLDSDILPSVQAGTTPERAIIDFAKKANWSPALVEAMGQLWNTAKTVTVFTKSANKGVTFRIIDVPALVHDFMHADSHFPVVKSASVGGIKSAAMSLGQLAKLVCVPPTLMTKLAKAAPPTVAAPKKVTIDQVKHAVAERDQAIFDLREDVSDALVKLARMVRNGDVNLPLLTSEYLAAHADPEVPQDVAHQVKRALTSLESHGVKNASATDLTPAKRALVNSQQPGWAELETATVGMTKLSRMHQVALMYKQATATKEKPATETETPRDQDQSSAGSVYGPNRTKTDTMSDMFTGNAANIRSRQTGENDKPSAPGNDIVSDIGKMLGAWSEPVRKGISEARQAFTPEGNPDQQYLDSSMADTRQLAMLQKLLLQDEVLSEADPAQVLAKFETLRKTMPSFADDPNVMRVSLRSAMQADGISPFDVKQLLDVESAAQRNASQKNTLDASAYKQKPAAKPKEETA